MIWEKDGTQEWSFFVDANMMHICTTNQRRAFDFKINGMCSRYTLLKEFDDAGNYNGVCLPAINVTTLPCTVRATLQFDALVMFGYTYNEFVADIGYSAWVRTHEVICLREGLPRNRYGLKGIQNVTDVASININTTQSTANIHGDPLDEQAIWVDTNPPVFVNTCNLDLTSAASPLVLTQKVFGHLGYSWPHYCNTNVTPFLGIGGELEFEGINERGVRHGDKNTLSQWSMWLKGGVAY
ncbi:MAG: hypothetical protein NTX86_02450 [Candidatus Dependentiae bacterium]|nr:hypothetical protein [Candidatus Dependentiae bacterium]